MRVDFVKALHQVINEDPQSTMITGDLGYNALEGIAASAGKRFLNAGVAEQNMIGVAAGVALSGFKPWVYSIAPFVTYRCLEQIRNDVCLHNLPVRLVGNGGGYTYGIMGSTHHALEDMAVLKALPNMTLFFPCGNDHVAAAVTAMNGLKTPSYLRLSISAFNTSFKPLAENPRTLTRHYANGGKVTVIGVGHGVQIALHALANGGLPEADVYGVARYPFDLDSDRELVESVRKTRRVIVLEEHYLAGSIAESLKLALPNTESFDVMCAQYSLDQTYGSPGFHLKQSKLTPDDLRQRVAQSLRSSNS